MSRVNILLIFIAKATALELHLQLAAINLRYYLYLFHRNGLNGAGCRVSHTNRPVKKQKGEPLKTGATS